MTEVVLFENTVTATYNEKWTSAVRQCIHEAVYDKALKVIVSPDVDGILSFYFVREYLKEHGISATLVGQYNSKEITAYQSEPIVLDRTLFLDLDVRFAKHVIGQHYLGEVTVPEKTYFNPNVFFQVQTVYASKYPFGTAHLVFWALFPTEKDRLKTFPILKNRFSLARSLIVHADSTYSNCHNYHRNAMNWCKRLFGDIDHAPRTLRMLLDASYRAHSLLVHRRLIQTLQPLVRGSSSVDSVVEWKHCGGHQTCVDISSVFALLRLCEQHFRTKTSGGSQKQVVTERLCWRGVLECVKYHVVGNNLEVFLQKNDVQSHAIVNMRTISVTFGKRPTNIL
jgi:hypothetical protein